MEALREIFPDLEEIDFFLSQLLPEEKVTAIDLIEDVMKGNWVLEPDVFVRFLQQALQNYIMEWKTLFVSILMLFIMSAVVGSCMEAFHNEGTAKSARLFFLLCQLIVLLNIWQKVLHITTQTISVLIEFLKLVIPGYMMCIAATGSGMTAAIFYKLLLGVVCLLEGIMISGLIPVTEAYMLLGVCESIFGEERFLGMMDMLKRGVLWILNGMIVLISGSGILQLLVTPVVDKAGLNVARKTVAAIPGIGDIAESISSVTLDSMMAIKNSLGVIILLILILLMLAPALRIFILLGTVKLGGAIGGICGERQMQKCTEYMADAGFLLLRLLITLTTLFFITIAALTNATATG